MITQEELGQRLARLEGRRDQLAEAGFKLDVGGTLEHVLESTRDLLFVSQSWDAENVGLMSRAESAIDTISREDVLLTLQALYEIQRTFANVRARDNLHGDDSIVLTDEYIVQVDQAIASVAAVKVREEESWRNYESFRDGQFSDTFVPYLEMARSIRLHQHASYKSDYLGKVVEVYGMQTLKITLANNAKTHLRDFVQTVYSVGDERYSLVAQVEHVFAQQQDTNRVDSIAQAVVRVVAAIRVRGDIVGKPSSITHCLQQPVFTADSEILKLIFSSHDKEDIADLLVGYLLGPDEGKTEVVPVVFNPLGLTRHSAVFGQSGSGKSFSFGIVLEQLLLQTEARILVLDPNNDYQDFRRYRDREDIIDFGRLVGTYTKDIHDSTNARWETELTPKFCSFADENLAVSFSEIEREAQAWLLGLDPQRDQDAFSAFLQIMNDESDVVHSQEDLLARLDAQPSLSNMRLRYSATTGPLEDASIFAKNSISQHLKAEASRDWRFASVNLKDVDQGERALIASVVLRDLYDEVKKTKQVTFIVIDEAHNLCPAEPWHPLQVHSLRIIQEIAAEGRKYGAFLMLLSQNPSKISPQILIQCDNFIVMKMVGSKEIRVLEDFLSQPGDRLVENASSLGKGQAICVGGIVRGLTTIQFDLRKTEPGGGDVPDDWAEKKC